MPSRNQTMIRRDINRLKETIERHKAAYPVLSAIYNKVTVATDNVNKCWQEYQKVSVTGDKEREERDDAIRSLLDWIQQWRPVIMLSVDGADSNIKKLPYGGNTPDDIIRVAEDMVKFLNSNSQASSFKTPAVSDLGNRLESAKKETSEATSSLPLESIARQNYTDACNEANKVLIRGIEVIRAIFGRTSPEYKQFIAKPSAKEEEEIEEEMSVGEE